MPQTFSANALPAGTMIQEYRILKVLGAGSFGIVYQAENVYLDEIVAIKEFLPSDLACRTEGTRVLPLSSSTEEPYLWALRQFLKEAQILWNLARPDRHPNIVRVSRFHEDNGTAYMVMDFEEGRSLAAILDERGRLPEADLRAILFPLLDGLERVHNASVWHRDIKPANILIRPDGSPVFIDFGAARQDRGDQARSIMAMYSPAYAAPEQVMSMGEQGPWTDIYSLAATLYRAVTGKTPTSVAERALGVAHVPAVEAGRGEYGPTLLLAIDKALSLQPRERPQRVAEWRQFLVASGPAVTADSEATVVASSLLGRPSPATGTALGTVSGHAAKHESILLSMPPAPQAPPARPAASPRKKRAAILAAATAGVVVAGAIAYALFGPRLWPVADDRDTARIPPAETYGAPLADTGDAAFPTPRRAEAPTTRDAADRTAEPPAAAPTESRATAAVAEPATTQPAPATVATPATTPAPTATPARAAEPARAPPSPPPPALATPPRAPAIDHTAVAAAVSKVVAGFDCADLSATLASDMTVFVSGRVASAKDQRALESRVGAVEHVKGVVPRVEILESPFCDVAGLLGPLGLSAGQGGRSGPAIGVNSPTRTFREGQFLVVEVTAGAGHQGHLYVGYLDSSGTWVHMLPSPLHPANAVVPGQRVVLGAEPAGDGREAQQYEIAPPHGRGMIIALASRIPLFQRPRPEIETLADYLPALDAELARLQAEGQLDEVSASALFIETRP
jgi:serine/threonine protein kinase